MMLRARKSPTIAASIRRGLLMLALFTFVCSRASGDTQTNETTNSNRIKKLSEALAKRAEAVYLDSTSKTSEATVQNLANAALYLCMSEGDPRKIEDLLRTEFGAQMMNDTYPSFGNLPSQINNTKLTNSNSLELGCQALGPIMAGYDSRLSPDFKKWLQPHLQAALIALRKHDVPVKNTSICLIKAVDLILIGAAIYDGDAIYEGTTLLDNWIAYTKQSGIHEFGSPVAYEADLNALNMGYLFAPDKLTKSKFKAILDYFWQDISAHYYPPTNSLTGAHSRDSDLLYGTGGIDLYAALAGLNTLPQASSVNLEKAYILLNAADGRGYRPSQRFLDLARTLPRTIECRWDDFPANDRYTFINRDFSMGSASGGNYGGQDKMILARFSSAKNLANITFRTINLSGAQSADSKAATGALIVNNHERCEPDAVQNQNKILMLLKIDTSKLSLNDNLATEFILPGTVDSLFFNNQKFNTNTQTTKTADQTLHCLGIREGKGSFVIRVFQADSLADDNSTVELASSPQDRINGVIRMRINHGLKQKKSPEFLKVGFVMVGAICPDDDSLLAIIKQTEDASIKQRLNETGWQVDAQIDNCLLTVNRDFAKPADTTRFVDGIEVQSPVFSVNGTLLGPSMWRHEDALLQRQTVSE